MSSSVIDAACLTAHEYPGGVKALSARMNKSHHVFYHKLNPNDQTNHLTVSELMQIMQLTGDHRALHAACTALGYTAIPLPSISTAKSIPDAITNMARGFAGFLQSTTDALADGTVTALELKRIVQDLGEMVAAAAQLEALVACKESKRDRS